MPSYLTDVRDDCLSILAHLQLECIDRAIKARALQMRPFCVSGGIQEEEKDVWAWKQIGEMRWVISEWQSGNQYPHPVILAWLSSYSRLLKGKPCDYHKTIHRRAGLKLLSCLCTFPVNRDKSSWLSCKFKNLPLTRSPKQEALAGKWAGLFPQAQRPHKSPPCSICFESHWTCLTGWDWRKGTNGKKSDGMDRDIFLSRPRGEADRAKGGGGGVFCSYWLTGWVHSSLRSVLFEVIPPAYFGHLFTSLTPERLGSRKYMMMSLVLGKHCWIFLFHSLVPVISWDLLCSSRPSFVFGCGFHGGLCGDFNSGTFFFLLLVKEVQLSRAFFLNHLPLFLFGIKVNIIKCPHEKVWQCEHNFVPSNTVSMFKAFNRFFSHCCVHQHKDLANFKIMQAWLEIISE